MNPIDPFALLALAVLVGVVGFVIGRISTAPAIPAPEPVRFDLTDETVARIAHEANRAYCIMKGDMSKKAWQNEDALVRTSTREGVRFRRLNPDATPEQMHEHWCKTKREQGYTYGTIVCHRERTHPCLVAYDKLPEQQRFKDHLFSAIVGLACTRTADASLFGQ